jgi:Lysyl oxidase
MQRRGIVRGLAAAGLVCIVQGAAWNMMPAAGPDDPEGPASVPHPGDPTPGETCEPIIPCSDPAGCPDLVVDARVLTLRYFQTRTFDDTTCAVQEGLIQAGTRRLLRFPTLMPNIGDGAISLGNPYNHPEWFEFNTCHGHAHFGEFAEYRLWTVPAWLRWVSARRANPDVCSRKLLTDHPELSTGLRAGHKQGFCLGDTYVTNYQTCGDVTPTPAVYTDCGDQGLSRCHADYYRATLDGQWIDVTGLAAGLYVFETEVNPARRITETNYGNNSAVVLINIPAS